MTSIPVAEFGNLLIDAIKSKDVDATLLLVQQYKDSMKNSSVGAEYVTWISEPANLTAVHKSLIDDLQIHPRLLAIKRVLMSRTQRSVLLVQAIEMAIRKTYKL